jgi:transposase-like protein
MNPTQENTPFFDILETLIENGAEHFREIFRIFLNEAMKLERNQFLQADPYERNDTRKGYANGYKPKTLNTRLGPVRVDVPQVRGLNFYPRSLEKGSRSEKALKLAIAEMYVTGISTRRVTKITEQLCGLQISSTQVSRLAKELDEQLQTFRNRPLGCFEYVYLDARYEKVRYQGSVRDVAVLIAVGANEGKPREVLGVSVSLSEAEIHWRTFLESLSNRGLHGMQLITSDDHHGLKAARQKVFPSVPWQRCQFHMQQNGQHYAPRVSMRRELADVMRNIFNAPDIHIAREMIQRAVLSYQDKAPEFVKWLEDNIEDGLTFFQFPAIHRRKIRTVNGLERLNQEIARRTRIARLFPNIESCLRLVSAVLVEINDDWMAGRMYLSKTNAKQENPDPQFYRKTVA